MFSRYFTLFKKRDSAVSRSGNSWGVFDETGCRQHGYSQQHRWPWHVLRDFSRFAGLKAEQPVETQCGDGTPSKGLKIGDISRVLMSDMNEILAHTSIIALAFCRIFVLLFCVFRRTFATFEIPECLPSSWPVKKWLLGVRDGLKIRNIINFFNKTSRRWFQSDILEGRLHGAACHSNG